jgi:polar amino acid transport system substrate-binding protein
MNFRKILTLSLVLTIFSANAVTKPLSVGWELWYPYQFHNNKQQLVGLDFDIFNAIISEANLSVNYTELPWKRHLNYLKTGEMDVAMGASYSSDRANYAYFTQAYRSELVKLYVRKNQADKIKLKSLDDLASSPYKIGVEAGYYYGENYQQLITTDQFRQRIIEVVDLEDSISLLLKDKLDGVLVDPITMSAFVDKYQLTDEFEEHDVIIYQDDISIMLSKKTMTEENLVRFNQAIAKLKNNGVLLAITKRWLNKK